MEEIWKDIKGYEGKYQVSSLGRVRRVEVLSEFTHTRGYKYVNITKDGQTKHKYIHRLVAETFIPNPMNLETVNHINEVKDDNKVSNLEWLSYYDNNHHGTAIERRSITRGKKVLQYSLDGEFIKEWNSAREIERELGYCNVSINQCCNGIIHKSKGFIWRFKE